jgi:glycerol-3-phosphate O-acyltransferase / dihydroxyacetone phosphate acyltransferase
MRPLYLFLRIALPYVLLVFYKRRFTIGSSNKINAQTIFVCNHPSAFQDPLIIASLQVSVVFFMVRSDVFKSWLKPITWAGHMVPIYRAAEDGKESLKKNKGIFEGVQKTLFRKKSIIIFAEGHTDNVFIRSLKPIKKGPARIGFGAMEACDWKEDIKVQACCVNYSSPSSFRSDVILSFGEPIHLQDYQKEYKDNPAAAITQVIRKVTKDMQDNLTYLDNKELADFLESLLILSRKGMNHENHDLRLKVKDKFNYSRGLSQRINAEFKEKEGDWFNLKQTTNEYFKEMKTAGIEEYQVYEFSKKNSKKNGTWWFAALLTFPLFILGCIHALIPYVIVKSFVEKTFKRSVFWSGVKMLMGSAVFSLYNLAFIWIIYGYIYPSYWVAILYYFSIPALSFIFAYQWKKKVHQLLKYKKIDATKLQYFSSWRDKILEKMNALGI